MAKKRKTTPLKPRSPFTSGLVIYIWVLLILGGIALMVLQDFLKTYELSQPGYCVDSYAETLRSRVPDSALHALDDLDPLVMSEEDRTDFIRSLLQDSELKKLPGESREDYLVYQVKAADGQPLGTVVFEPVARTKYNLPVWSQVSDSFDFSAYYTTLGVTVPSDYRVYLGDLLLGADRIVERDIPYSILADYYESFPELPTMVRYETVPFVGEGKLRVLDRDGREIEADQLTEEAFLDRCPEEIREKAEVFVPEFIELYVYFSSDLNGSAHYYFDQLRPYILQDSELFVRLRQAFEGLGYNLQIRTVSLESVELNRIIPLEKDRYLVDLHYTTVIGTRGNDPTETDDHVLLVLADVDGKLLADALYFQ